MAFDIAPEEKIAWAQILGPPNVTTHRDNMLGKDFTQNVELCVYSLTARILSILIKKNCPISAENSRSDLRNTGFRSNCHEYCLNVGDEVGGFMILYVLFTFV